MKRQLFVGVDGGQSSTLAGVWDGTGQLLGIGRAGPSNHIHEPGGRERLQQALRKSIGDALVKAGISEDRFSTIELEAAGCGMTGGWEWVPDVLAGFLRVRHLIAEPDMVTAHAGAFAGGPGVVVIAGTGSIAYGVNAAGFRQRSGGWGYVMGDEGSGYDIGRNALVAAARAEDGRGPRSSLLPVLLDHFQMHSLWDLRTAIYSAAINRTQIAEIAPLVFRASDAGDEAARQIIDRAATHLAEVAAAALANLAWEGPAPIALIGGVFRAGAVILEPFLARLTQWAPEAKVLPARFPPVIGALLLAYQAAGIGVSAERLVRLDAVQKEMQLKQ